MAVVAVLCVSSLPLQEHHVYQVRFELNLRD